MANYSAHIAFLSRFGAAIFIVAKFLRFTFFLLFLVLLFSKTGKVGRYSFWQLIFFFSTFNFIDSLAQFFLREVYRFRYYVVSGDFDYFLTKPISPLFRSLFGGSDILDVPMLFASAIFILFSASHLGTANSADVTLYLILLVNAFVIALAFHIFTLGLAVLTTEIDNTIMMYRDITQMGRIPVEIYKRPLSTILTFIVPVGIMMTFPAKALMGLLSAKFVLFAVIFSLIFIVGSLRFWKYALKNYSSAST